MGRKGWLAALLAVLIVVSGAALLQMRGFLNPPRNVPRSLPVTNVPPTGSQDIAVTQPPAREETEAVSCVLRVDASMLVTDPGTFEVTYSWPDAVALTVTDSDILDCPPGSFFAGRAVIEGPEEGKKEGVKEWFLGIGQTIELWAEVMGVPEEEIEELVWSKDNDSMTFVREDGSDFAPGTEVTGKRVTIKAVKRGKTHFSVEIKTKER